VKRTKIITEVGDMMGCAVWRFKIYKCNCIHRTYPKVLFVMHCVAWRLENYIYFQKQNTFFLNTSWAKGWTIGILGFDSGRVLEFLSSPPRP